MAIGGFLHIPPDMRCTAYSEGWVKNLYPDHTPCSSASHRVVHVAVYPLNIASQIFRWCPLIAWMNMNKREARTLAIHS